MANRFSIGSRFRSLRYALSGVAILLTSQHNAWLHAVSTIVIVSMGFYFGLAPWEWCVIVLAIGGVWMTEAFNTALEFLADAVSADFHLSIKQAKDVSAGAVLIAAILSVILGLIVLGPHCLAWLKAVFG